MVSQNLYDFLISQNNPDFFLYHKFDFDGNGMNSFSCKDTKHEVELTLIDKNVI